MWRNHRLHTDKIKWKSKRICKYMGSTVTHGISSVKYWENKKSSNDKKQVTQYVEMLPVYLPCLMSQLQCQSDGTMIFQDDGAPSHFHTKVFVHLTYKLIGHSSWIPHFWQFGPWGFMNDVLQISPVLWAAVVCHKDGKQDGSAHASGRPCEFILNTCR